MSLENFPNFRTILSTFNFCHLRKFSPQLIFSCSAFSDPSRQCVTARWKKVDDHRIASGMELKSIVERRRLVYPKEIEDKEVESKKKKPSESSWEKRSWRNVEEKKEVGEHVKLRDSTAQHFEMQKLREFYSFALFFLPCRGSLLGESKFSKWKKKWSGSGFTFVWASHSRLYYVTQHDHTIGPGRRVYVAFFLTIVMSWYKFHFHPQTLRRLSLSFHTQHRPRVFGRRRHRLLSHPPPDDYIVHRVFETINEPRIYIRYISRSIEL